MNSVKPLFLIPLSLGIAVFLGACRSDHVAVDRKDPRSPQFAYRLDELAMLQMAVDDIQDLEQEKHYGKVYDDFASPEFKAQISRRRFLIWGNCAETYLGGLEEYDRNELGFFRAQVKKQAPVDSIVRTVHRTKYLARERMGFVYDGIHFKLVNWTWISNDKPFLQCMEESAQLEKSGQAVEESAENNNQSSKDDASNSHSIEAASERNGSNASPMVSKDASLQKNLDQASSPERGHSDSSGVNSSEKSSADDTTHLRGNSEPSSPAASPEPSSLHYARVRSYHPKVEHRVIKSIPNNDKASEQNGLNSGSPPVPPQH